MFISVDGNSCASCQRWLSWVYENTAQTRYEGRQLAELRQQGWTIEYLAYDDDGHLPKRVRLTRGAMDIRLAIEEWQVAPR